MKKKSPRPATRPAEGGVTWQWIVLAVWLGVTATQIWSMQIEAVRAGEVCSVAATPQTKGDKQ